MGSHQTYNIILETYIELQEGFDTPVVFEGVVELFTDPCYGMDADGRRCEVRTEVNSIELDRFHIHFPGRPGLCAITGHDKICYWLGPEETDSVMEQMSEKAFREEWEEV